MNEGPNNTTIPAPEKPAASVASATILQVLPAMGEGGGVERGTVEIAQAIADIMERFYQRYRDAVAALIAEALPGIAEATRRRRATLIVAMIEGLSLFRSGRDRALRREAIAAAAALARGAPPAEG